MTEADGFDVVDRLERLILDHEPRSAAEAAAMLEMVGENLEAGGRSDGRDVRALKRVIAFLRPDG
ncbi:MAG: hypothetical protein K5831_16790 [Brevundimonas sp.]|uniref:Uncharacterized protein n=1 Tax=Brevundimonas albigilva TaxID=1312364 RepID=A0ABY4SLR2_9CAUL|nr:MULTISPECIES: hypothetical protein [Brevundimonas]MCV0416523.1 hypothetical protein [Brevundimonas sp.]URI15000.1 hypothetical protein M8231_14530 [Brevundimonas albigilva]